MNSREGVHIILASASPRRKVILEAMGFVPEVSSGDTEELVRGEPISVAVRNALNKAIGAKERSDHELPASSVIVGCDTLVALDDLMIGKQNGSDEVRDVLLRLSGRTHSVISGLALLHNGEYLVSSCTTKVSMNVISPGEAEWYASEGDWSGKAGGYSIQGLAGRFVRNVRGSMFNVIGFPLELFVSCLGQLGHDPGDRWPLLDPGHLFPGGRLGGV